MNDLRMVQTNKKDFKKGMLCLFVGLVNNVVDRYYHEEKKDGREVNFDGIYLC